MRCYIFGILLILEISSHTLGPIRQTFRPQDAVLIVSKEETFDDFSRAQLNCDNRLICFVTRTISIAGWFKLDFLL